MKIYQKILNIKRFRMSVEVEKLAENLEKLTFDNFLKKRYMEEMKKNDDIVKVAVDKKYKELIKKIDNHINEKLLEDERDIVDREKVLEMIKENPLIRSFFRKDPIKQNFHENHQIEWIKLHKHEEVVCLPKTTSNGFYLSKKKLNTGRKALPAETKTFDFLVESKKIYGVLKYTSDAGGSQDNQFNDVKKFIEKIIEYYETNPEAEEKFEIYLDGTYYTLKKLKELKDMIPEEYKEKILVGSVADF